MIMQEFHDIKHPIEGASQYIVLIAICLLLLPVVMIRQFNRIKVNLWNDYIKIQILGVIIMTIIVLALLSTLVFSITQFAQPGDHPKVQPIAWPTEYQNVLPFIPRIAYAFEYQVYFMIVYPYLGKSQRVYYGTRLSIYTSSFMLVFCLLFAIFTLGSTKLILYSYGIVEVIYVEEFTWGTQTLDWMIIVLQML